MTSNATHVAEVTELYQSQRTGPLANPGGEFILFLPFSNFTDQAAHLQDRARGQDASGLMPGASSSVQLGYAQQHSILTQGLSSESLTPLEVFWNDGAIVVGLQHPYSRGSVKVVSNDPFSPPAVDLGYLSNSLDLAVLVEGVKFTRNIMVTQAVVEAMPLEIVPGANITDTADIEEFIKQNIATFAHYSGIAMMAALEFGGVVDTSFSVHGVQNLRVVDASVIPLMPAGHTSSAVYALAEKVSTFSDCMILHSTYSIL